MIINDVLPLKAARRDAIANFKCFGAPACQLRNLDSCIYIHYATPPYSARAGSIYLLPFGKVWLGPFADLRVQGLAKKQNAQFTEDARKLR